MNSIKLLFLFIVLGYVVINGLLWNFTENRISKIKLNKFFVYWGKFFLVAGVYISLIGVLFYNTIKSFVGSFMAGSVLNFNFISFFVLIFLVYFMYISLALIGKTGLKDILKKTALIGIKKIHIMLLLYLISFFVIVLFSFLAGLAAGLHLIVMYIAVVLFIFSLVWVRIFFVLVVNKLEV